VLNFYLARYDTLYLFFLKQFHPHLGQLKNIKSITQERKWRIFFEDLRAKSGYQVGLAIVHSLEEFLVSGQPSPPPFIPIPPGGGRGGGEVTGAGLLEAFPVLYVRLLGRRT
jgi:hypothetical protein